MGTVNMDCSSQQISKLHAMLVASINAAVIATAWQTINGTGLCHTMVVNAVLACAEGIVWLAAVSVPPVRLSCRCDPLSMRVHEQYGSCDGDCFCVLVERQGKVGVFDIHRDRC